MRWRQGEVIEKRNKVQRVRILWDPLSIGAECNDYTESDKVIDPKLRFIVECVIVAIKVIVAWDHVVAGAV